MASPDGFTPIPDDPSSLPLIGSSAFVGQPPATQHDYYVVKGLLRMVGMAEANPMTGYFLAAKPPPGYVHETRLPGVLTGLIFVLLAILVPTAARIGLRLRRGSSMQFGWDDWAISVAALLALVYPITQIYSLATGAAAKHIWEVTYEQYSFGMVVAMICKTTFYVAVGMIKLSIAIFVRRLADRPNRWWRVSCNVFIASVVAYMILAIFFNVFACDPPAIQWDLALRGRLEPMPTCIDLGVQAKILSGIHVAQGLMLLFIPIVILWKVRMQTAKKVRLFAIWTIGGVTVLGGLLRQLRPTMTNDFTWDYVEVLVWTCLDLSLGILAASLPVLDGLLEKYWRKAKNTVINTHGDAGGVSQSTTIARTWQYSKASDTEKSRKTTARTSIIASTMARSESSESIVKKDHLQESKCGGMEMSILCTQEVEVHVSDAVEDVEKGQDKARGPRAPSPFYHNRPEWHDRSHRF
ncbi:integral membrane protein [Colletotrichum higginsianum]|nr:integral membrane protein [Colletotrichum higginsianum]